MKMLLLIERIKNKIFRTYRKIVFREMIGCPHNQFSLVGKMTLINHNIKLGRNVTIYPDCMFFGDGLIEIGDNVDIGQGTVIYASQSGGVSIGCNTIIAAQCYIIDMDHGINPNELIRNQKDTVNPVKIGDDVWIAAGAKILKGSILEDGCVVAAGAVVKGVVKRFDIVAGVPARTIKSRK